MPNVTLRHNNSPKLATTSTGIDVTGTVTADGLSIGGTSNFTSLVRLTGDRGTFVDSSENSAVPHIFATNDAVGDFSQEAGHLVIQSRVHTSVYRDIIFAGGTTNAKRLMTIQGEGDISFFEDTGTTAKLFWDASAESLGIGTTSPSFPLEVDGGTGDGIKIKAGNTSNDDSFLVANSSDTTMFLVDGGGNVGIGTSSPARRLSVNSAGTQIAARFESSSTNSGRIALLDANTTADNYVNVAASGDDLALYAGGAEYVRVNDGGNLLVGKTSDDNTTTGMVVGQNGFTKIVRTSGTANVNTVLQLNRLATDGEILRLQKDGTTVGSIATTSNRLSIGSNDVGLFFDSTNERVTPIDQDNQTDRDAAIDLGYASSRFRDLYLSGNVTHGTAPSSSAAGVFTEAVGRTTYSRGSGTGGFANLSFINGNGTVGSVVTSGYATAYNTSSDYRLKENVVTLTGATARLNQLAPKRFNFIGDTDVTVDGFLAHEVADVVPEAITGAKDAIDDEGNAVYQGIDQSKLVPLLVATIQELEARIAALESN